MLSDDRAPLFPARLQRVQDSSVRRKVRAQSVQYLLGRKKLCFCFLAGIFQALHVRSLPFADCRGSCLPAAGCGGLLSVIGVDLTAELIGRLPLILSGSGFPFFLCIRLRSPEIVVLPFSRFRILRHTRQIAVQLLDHGLRPLSACPRLDSLSGSLRKCFFLFFAPHFLCAQYAARLFLRGVIFGGVQFPKCLSGRRKILRSPGGLLRGRLFAGTKLLFALLDPCQRSFDRLKSQGVVLQFVSFLLQRVHLRFEKVGRVRQADLLFEKIPQCFFHPAVQLVIDSFQTLLFLFVTALRGAVVLCFLVGFLQKRIHLGCHFLQLFSGKSAGRAGDPARMRVVHRSADRARNAGAKLRRQYARLLVQIGIVGFLQRRAFLVVLFSARQIGLCQRAHLARQGVGLFPGLQRRIRFRKDPVQLPVSDCAQFQALVGAVQLIRLFSPGLFLLLHGVERSGSFRSLIGGFFALPFALVRRFSSFPDPRKDLQSAVHPLPHCREL